MKRRQKPHFKQVGTRVDAAGQSAPVCDIDNHRSPDNFGGYMHRFDVPTLAELQEIAERLIDDREMHEINEKFEENKKRRFLTGLGDVFARSAGSMYIEQEKKYEPPGRLSSEFVDTLYRIGDGPANNFNSISLKDFFSQGMSHAQEAGLTGNSMLSQPFSPFDEKASAARTTESGSPQICENDDLFEEHARWRFKYSTDQIDPEWEALQESLAPSLCDEDVLGSWDEFFERRQTQPQFLLLGDSNHYDKDLRKWFEGGAYIHSLKEMGIRHLVVEAPERCTNAVQRFYSGSTREHDPAFLESFRLSSICESGKAAGIRIHCLDQQLDEGKVPSNEDRYRHEEPLAQAIQRAVGSGKTAIIYGGGHFSYQGGLMDLLGRDKCLLLDVYSSLETYRNHFLKTNRNYVAPYVYLVEEDRVIKPHGKYGRDSQPSRDRFLQAVQQVETERVHEKFEGWLSDRVNYDLDRYGRITAKEVYREYEQPNQSGFKRAPYPKTSLSLKFI